MNNYYFLPPNEKIKSEFKSEIKSEPSMSHSNTQLVGIKKNPFGSKKYKFGRSSKQRREKKIKKLFDKLRNETITLDSTDDYTPDANNTVIVLDDTIKQYPQKRKLSDTSIDEQTAPKKEDTKPIRIVESTTEPYNSVQNLKIETSDSVIITDDVVLQKKDSISNSSKKRKVNISDTNIHIQIVSDDNDVSQIKSEPCSSKTPRKKGIAPPINCSTPITKSNTSLVCNNNADSTKNLNADANETKVINRDSFLTIDLTMDSDLSKLQCNTIIDLDNTQESHDCTFVSMSNASSMSGDSQVTVLHRNSTNSKHMNKFVSGIAKLDASEKGKLLEIITEKIFSGCKVQQRLNGNASNAVRTTKNQAVETAENTYIKEVILGEKQSRNSIGSNIYNPEKDAKNKTGLRMIVIDGSNVAMECKFGKSSEPRLLDELERRGFVVYTPSREIKGKIVSAYDDRYIVQCAAEFDGVIVSGDNYRDLLQENPRWRFVIENRLLPFTWVNDMIMFPRDPLGRNGPTLEQFLRHPAPESVTSIVL